jgi:EF-P beta-lysylation protein EpmB
MKCSLKAANQVRTATSISDASKEENRKTALHWRELLKRNFTKWDPLCTFLELDPPLRAQILQKSAFPLNLPFRLAQKIEKNRLDDPILRQFVPLSAEEEPVDGFLQDPLAESLFCKTPKFIHKYRSRALLIPTSACAMHCRYCFRRHFPYEVHDKSLQSEIALIAQDPSLEEIILSGGDPLSLSNTALETLLDALEAIPHIKRVRLHTRFPIGIPERLDEQFLSLLERRYQIWMVIHCNHPRELDDDVIAGLKGVMRCGIPVLNQAVLLKGVNDSVESLTLLCTRLVDSGILPYYLHQLDRVQGAHHFEVDEERGFALIEELRRQVSGYAVPQYVREIPGAESKIRLLPSTT